MRRELERRAPSSRKQGLFPPELILIIPHPEHNETDNLQAGLLT
jgi:hypothetical protein